MFFYEGYNCPVCNQPFKADDDVVVCPDCGAPHHRACWKQETHCHFADKHGTAEQWSREKQAYTAADQAVHNVCPQCGHDNTAFAEFCSHCGKSLQTKDWNSTQQDTTAKENVYGGYGEYRPFTAAPSVHVPDDTDIDGVSAKELYTYTGKNGHYYVTRFQQLFERGKSFSWNWAAFLLTPYWLWYRKQYVAGAIALLMEGIRAVISSFFLYGYIGFSNIVSEDELVATLQRLSTDATFMRWVVIIYMTMFISGILRVFFGAFGNYLYFRTAKKRILQYRGIANKHALSAAGGVSVAFGVIAYLVLYAISTISNFLFL